MGHPTLRDVLSACEIASGVYSLVPPKGTKRVTIRHQQVRAVNLIAALAEKHSPNFEKLRLCIIGAGVAGWTAAMAASRLGLRNDRKYRSAKVERLIVLERLAKELWNLRDGSTRWVHPWRYLWPEPAWANDETWFPSANWEGGYADDVFQQLRREIRPFRLEPEVENIVIHEGERGALCVSFRKFDKVHSDFQADVVIIAAGPGIERQQALAINSSYWLDDNIHREDPYRGHASYLLVGNGDGALTDLLRIRFDAPHEQIVGTLNELSCKKGSVSPTGSTWAEFYRLRVAEIESSEGTVEQKWADYQKLVTDYPLTFPKRRPLTKVTVIADAGGFGEVSFALHRLWLAQLHIWDEATEIKAGRAKDDTIQRDHADVGVHRHVRLMVQGGSMEAGHHFVSRVGFTPTPLAAFFGDDATTKLRFPTSPDFDAVGAPFWAAPPPHVVRLQKDLARNDEEFRIYSRPVGTPAETPLPYATMLVSLDVALVPSAYTSPTCLGLVLDETTHALHYWGPSDVPAVYDLPEDGVLVLVCKTVRPDGVRVSRRFALLRQLIRPTDPNAGALREAIWAGATHAIVLGDIDEGEARDVLEAWQAQPIPSFGFFLVTAEWSALVALDHTLNTEDPVFP
jgi:hypothetical protein